MSSAELIILTICICSLLSSSFSRHAPLLIFLTMASGLVWELTSFLLLLPPTLVQPSLLPRPLYQGLIMSPHCSSSDRSCHRACTYCPLVPDLGHSRVKMSPG